MKLEEKIEDLIEKKASDFEISKLFKHEISEYKNSLQDLFESNQGKDFLVKHTKALDDILTSMYKTILRRSFGNHLPMRGSVPITLVALGSYGREQLCVHSDIDLLIVYEDIEGYNTKLIIEKLLYLAWDAGMKLGHRVHEVSDLSKAAFEDITIRTSMMESRLITGSPFTWHATQRQLSMIRHTHPKEFILQKIDEAHIRREKFPLSMQPNIKESVGGLRDSQLLFWVAKTIYDVSSLRELSGRLFKEERYREYRVALELLFRVRSALHLICSKQQDQLLFEHMPAVARMLGFANERKLITKVLEAQWRINSFTQIFVKKMLRPYLKNEIDFTTLRRARIQKNFYCIDDRIFSPMSVYNLKIEPLLEFLISLEDKPWKFDPSTIAIFTYCSIQHPLKKSIYALIKKLFEREHLFSYLTLFYDAGILHELFSVFRKVHHLPQFDGYHRYPVDYHSIKCIEALENIKEPFILKLYQSLTKQQQTLVKITTLIHDTGKGRKQDHSEVGAKLIIPFAKKLGFNESLQQQAALLVKYHVYMSKVAFNENIFNEKTLYKFMSNIKTLENLELLYVLTYADINGVGAGTYTSFNSKLLYDLYKGAKEVSQNSERITDASKRLKIERRIQNHERFQSLSRLQQKKILTIESNLFFFKRSVEDILDISQKAREVSTYAYHLDSNKPFSIEIFRKIPLNLGYLLGSLSYLDVVSMDIFTLFDSVKYFKVEFALEPSEDTYDQIAMIIEESFDMERTVKLTSPTIKKSEISIDCEHSKDYAELSIHTSNQKGLLAYIVQNLEELHINILTAKIHSTKKRANDNFLIEKEHSMCDNAIKAIDKLVQGNV
jgi:[protein-PII] uridylyltransferase